MKKFTFLVLALVLTVGVVDFMRTDSVGAADRPNILWITAEDMSPVLGCYGDDFAITPHLDQFAKQGVLYTNAFSSAPVCSPSRACLINGLQAPSQGTQQMRSAFPIPSYMTGFPSLLRGQGYYATNNVKTDYNSGNWKEIIEASWDENSPTADWSKKKKGQPFFAIFNLMTSHQSRSMVWPYAKFVSEVQSKLGKHEIHEPANVPLPPYYVDTPVVRKHLARFYDCVTVMDKQVGAILKKLEDDGLADDTIVFFYSDHGSGMPRHKRALLDSGTRVAMMVRVPEKYKHLAPGKVGSKTDRLVSFEDFAPSVLSLAGIKIPSYMEGKAFLGKKAAKPRTYVYGHRDRVDEVHDLGRSVRDGQYLFIRNYMPHLSYNQPTAWPDLGEIRHEFYRLAQRKNMTAAQWHFAGPTRPVEELYDCQSDPHNLVNLIDNSKYADKAAQLRKQLVKHIHSSKDLGFIPESLAWKWTKGTTPYEFARKKSAYNQKKLVAAASLVGVGTQKQFVSNLRSNDAGVRYWGAVALSACASLEDSSASALVKALHDQAVNVRVEAANALLRKGSSKPALFALSSALKSESLEAVLHAARTIELLGEKAKSLKSVMQETDARMLKVRPANTSPTVVQPGRIDMAMFVGFSTKAFLAGLE